MQIFYSITDDFPAYRVDIKELFGEELTRRGLSIEWFMASDGRCRSGQVIYLGQPVSLPPAFAANRRIVRKINRLFYIAADCWQVLKAFLSRRVELVQCRDQFIASSLAVLLSRITGKPFVYWCSYPFPEHHMDVGKLRKGFKGTLQHFKGAVEFMVLYRFVMRLATHSFVQTDQMLRDIASYGIPAARMTPVPMGVPEKLLHWAQEQKIEVVPGRVVYIGTFGAVRRLEMLIDAFAMLHKTNPAATLYMVGAGDYPHERTALEDAARRLGVEQAVVFTGFVPIEQAWTYAASAAVCVSPFYPSQVLASASPTKQVEYMAMGRPVVCNTHPEQSEIIASSGAGLCVEWDAKAFADAMAWMLDHPAEAEAMGASGPAWVAEHRTYPILAETVWRKYQEILGGGR